MPAPSGREILEARNSDPAREGTRRNLPVLARDAEQARRVEGMAGDHRFSNEAVRGQVCPVRHGWMVEIGALADIERRMGVEDLQSVHQEGREADDIDQCATRTGPAWRRYQRSATGQSGVGTVAISCSSGSGAPPARRTYFACC